MASLLPLLALIARSAAFARALAERYPRPAFALPTAPKWRHERPQTGFVTAGSRSAAGAGRRPRPRPGEQYRADDWRIPRVE